jgi:hypothetical protein
MVALRVRDVLSPGDDVEVVFTYPANPDVKHRCLAKINSFSSQGNEVLLTCEPDSPSYPEWLQPNATAYLYTMKQNGIWGCTLENISGIGTLLRGIVPEGIDQVQRRRHVRVNYNGFVTLEVEHIAEQHTIGTTAALNRFSMEIQNISAGGMRIVSPISLLNEQVVKLEFDVKTHPRQGKPDTRAYALKARVLYSYIPVNQPSSKPILIDRGIQNDFICALQFMDVPPSIEKQILQQCFQLEIEQRKANQPLML